MHEWLTQAPVSTGKEYPEIPADRTVPVIPVYRAEAIRMLREQAAVAVTPEQAARWTGGSIHIVGSVFLIRGVEAIGLHTVCRVTQSGAITSVFCGALGSPGWTDLVSNPIVVCLPHAPTEVRVRYWQAQ